MNMPIRAAVWLLTRSASLPQSYSCKSHSFRCLDMTTMDEEIKNHFFLLHVEHRHVRFLFQPFRVATAVTNGVSYSIKWFASSLRLCVCRGFPRRLLEASGVALPVENSSLSPSVFLRAIQEPSCFSIARPRTSIEGNPHPMSATPGGAVSAKRKGTVVNLRAEP